jgi:transcriptional regulator with XRE-family HTH domain
VRPIVSGGNSSKGMANTPAPRYDGRVNRFPSELRRWRAARRRSQLELAVQAGTTQRHVSFIEQGRSRPGRGIVVRLAEALELSLRERNELLLAAGYAPAFPESALDDEALRPVRRALDTILDGHLPYPAMVVRPHGVLVTANRAFDSSTKVLMSRYWDHRSTSSGWHSTPMASRPVSATCVSGGPTHHREPSCPAGAQP